MRAAWWWIDRWRTSDAYATLTAAEQGAYRNLLDELWLRNGLLPEDDRLLARASGVPDEWAGLREAVMRQFVKVEGGYRNTTHDEVQAESMKRADKQRRYRENAKKKSTVTGNVTVTQTETFLKRSSNVPSSPSPSPSLSPDQDPGQKTENPDLSGGPDLFVSSPSKPEAEAEPAPTGPKGKAIPPLVEAWNRAATDLGLPKVTVVSAKRQQAIRAALKDEADLSRWERAFRLIGADPFLRGKNDRGKVYGDFDFAIRSDQRGKWLDLAGHEEVKRDLPPLRSPEEDAEWRRKNTDALMRRISS